MHPQHPAAEWLIIQLRRLSTQRPCVVTAAPGLKLRRMARRALQGNGDGFLIPVSVVVWEPARVYTQHERTQQQHQADKPHPEQDRRQDFLTVHDSDLFDGRLNKLPEPQHPTTRHLNASAIRPLQNG